jgi:hypothetical protein
LFESFYGFKTARPLDHQLFQSVHAESIQPHVSEKPAHGPVSRMWD